MHLDFRLDRLVSLQDASVCSPYDRLYDFLPKDLGQLLKLMLANQRFRRKVGFKPMKKITLPSTEAPKLLGYLGKFGFHGGTIYPGLSGVADAAKERAQYQLLIDSADLSQVSRQMESLEKLKA